MSDLQNLVSENLKSALAEIETAADLKDLENIKNKYLSKKGIFSEFMQSLAKTTAEERPLLGKIINEAKVEVVNNLNLKVEGLEKALAEEKLAKESVDITLEGRKNFLGSHHPITLAKRAIVDWFAKQGFVVRAGLEIEDDFHNFTALNIPPEHPARAMQDTFYFNPETVLRTQTSGAQIHVLENEPLPLRMISPGRVYRSDYDMTHSPMFHQCEGLVIDESSTFADLKGILIYFLKDFFGRDDIKIRFRPSFFPFTEPSAEVDISFGDSNKWLEVLGCGMVHPNVLKNVNIDPQKYQGYAFGMGIERLAMLKYGISDLRLFFENDQRFLNQFARV